MILVNTHLPASAWRVINIQSPDITAIDYFGEAFGTIRIVNIYSNCDDNFSLDALRDFLRSPAVARCPVGTLRYIWVGDFNRHHPLWDEIRNQHLFTKKNLDLAQPLLDLLARHSMAMALPRDIPTLRALRSKNFTRPDNVFCSASLLPAYTTGTTDPAKMPPKTDHFPVI
jgi:endonuclease/exonuclease/phosphatase family metal-dependent hydrolase